MFCARFSPALDPKDNADCPSGEDHLPTRSTSVGASSTGTPTEQSIYPVAQKNFWIGWPPPKAPEAMSAHHPNPMRTSTSARFNRGTKLGFIGTP